MGRAEGISWLAMEPVTGRTHQLRVHSAAMGWPIIGDNIYGKAPRFEGPILHLHAREVVVPISKNKPPVKVTAPVPQHMKERLMLCGWREEINSRIVKRFREGRRLAHSRASGNPVLGPAFAGTCDRDGVHTNDRKPTPQSAPCHHAMR